MLKMGLPEGAVRNKMLQDGVEDPEGLWAECEAVLNESNGSSNGHKKKKSTLSMGLGGLTDMLKRKGTAATTSKRKDKDGEGKGAPTSPVTSCDVTREP
jgi:hypothetical protein